MLYIVIKLDENERTDIQGVKETLSAYCEQFGDIKLIDVNATQRPRAEQIAFMEDKKNLNRICKNCGARLDPGEPCECGGEVGKVKNEPKPAHPRKYEKPGVPMPEDIAAMFIPAAREG